MDIQSLGAGYLYIECVNLQFQDAIFMMARHMTEILNYPVVNDANTQVLYRTDFRKEKKKLVTGKGYRGMLNKGNSQMLDTTLEIVRHMTKIIKYPMESDGNIQVILVIR